MTENEKEIVARGLLQSWIDETMKYRNTPLRVRKKFSVEWIEKHFQKLDAIEQKLLLLGYKITLDEKLVML